MTPHEFVEECIQHPSFNGAKLTFNDLIAILNQPRDVARPEDVDIFCRLNPFRREEDFLVYHLFLDNDIISFIKTSAEDFLSDAGREGDSDPDSAASQSVDEAVVEYIKFIHRKRENSDMLNRVLYYLEPVHRFLSFSVILLNFQSKTLNRPNPLRQSPAKSDPKTAKQAQAGELSRVYSILRKDRLGPGDFAALKTLILQSCFDQEFAKIRLGRLSPACKLKVLVCRLTCVLGCYRYSSLKPFEGIKSLAVLELLKKESNISFTGIGRVKEVFFEMEMKMGFVKTDELLIRLMNDEQAYGHMCEKIRKPLAKMDSRFEFFDENFNELLQRVEVESEKYIDWDEFKQYFSYRGASRRNWRLPRHVPALHRKQPRYRRAARRARRQSPRPRQGGG